MTKAEALEVLAIARTQSSSRQQENMREIDEALKVAIAECDEDQFAYAAHHVVMSSRLLHFVFHKK